MVDVYWSPGILFTGTVMGVVGLLILLAFGRKFDMELDSPKTWLKASFIPWFGWQMILFAHFLINYVWKDYIQWYKLLSLSWITENPVIQTANPIAFALTNPIGAIFTWGTEYLAAFVIVMTFSALFHKQGIEPRG